MLAGSARVCCRSSGEVMGIVARSTGETSPWKKWVGIAAATGALAGVAVGALGGPVASGADAATGYPVSLGLLAVFGAAGAVIVTRPEAGLYALLVTAPLADVFSVQLVGAKITPFVAALVACALAWVRELAARHRSGVVRPPLGLMAWALVGPLLAALWSLPLSLDPSKTVSSAGRLAVLWLMACFVVTQARGKAVQRRMLAVAVVVGVCLTGLAAAQFADPGLGIGRMHVQRVLGGGVGLIRPSGFYLDPNFLGGMLAAACVAGAAMVLSGRQGRAAALWAIGSLTCAAGVVLTSSRSALASLAVGAVVAVIAAPRRRRAAVAAALAAAALLVALTVPSSLVGRLAALRDPLQTSSVATRYLMVGSTVEMLGDYWTTGTGLGAFERAYPAYRSVGSLHRVTRPHQVPLAMWAEMGIGGLLAQVWIAVTAVWAVRARRRVGWSATDTAVTAGALSLVVGSLFQYYLYFEHLWLFAALVAAVPCRGMAEGGVRDA